MAQAVSPHGLSIAGSSRLVRPGSNPAPDTQEHDSCWLRQWLGDRHVSPPEGLSVEEMYGRESKGGTGVVATPQKGVKVITMPVRPDFESPECLVDTLTNSLHFFYNNFYFFILLRLSKHLKKNHILGQILSFFNLTISPIYLRKILIF